MDTYTVNFVGQSIIHNIRTQVFSRIQHLPVSYHDKNPSGRLVIRVTNDIETLNELFSSGIIMIFGDLFLLIGSLALMFYLDVRLTLVCMGVVPFLVAGVVIFKNVIRPLFREIRKKIARLNAYLSETIFGIKVVKAFSKEQECYHKFDNINTEVMTLWNRAHRTYSTFYPFVELISSMAIAILLWYGGVNILNKTLTFGTFVAFWYCVQKFFQPLWDLAEKYNILQAALASSERIFKILDTQPEPIGNALSANKIRGDIQIIDVSFSYDDKKVVLDNVSLCVKEGEKVGVVGLTGAGKTTLVSLINKLYHLKNGQILIGGRNINEIDLSELRKSIAYVPQDVFIFAGTIKENVALSQENIDYEKVVEVCKYVNAYDFIQKLPDGFDTDVKERGIELSLGQRQLISFARALYFNPEIIILDEATSSIDTQTEAIIQEAVLKLIKGRTAIIIAHRLSTLRNVDKIVVLHNGRIVEEGKFDNLIKKRGYFYKLCQSQFPLYFDEQKDAFAMVYP
jgi:ABC-type multidrug transport system fused ATPase/permease subunit